MITASGVISTTWLSSTCSGHLHVAALRGTDSRHGNQCWSGALKIVATEIQHGQITGKQSP